MSAVAEHSSVASALQNKAALQHCIMQQLPVMHSFFFEFMRAYQKSHFGA